MTVRDIKLSAENDLMVSGRDLVMVSDLEAVEQAVRIKLQFIKGEWFLDANAGTPYFDGVFGKGNGLHLVSSLLRRSILDVPGVNEVTALNLSVNNETRKLTVSFKASTDLGEIESTQEVG